MGEKSRNFKFYIKSEDGIKPVDYKVSDAEIILDDDKNTKSESNVFIPNNSEFSMDINDKNIIKKLNKLAKPRWYERLLLRIWLHRIKKITNYFEEGNEGLDEKTDGR